MTRRLVLAFVLCACGSTGGATDSGSNLPDSGSNLPDSGSNVPDSGTNLPDSGSNLPDSGSNLPDSGSNLPDSGLNVPDSGSNVPDSGTNLPDSGTTSPDAGCVVGGFDVPGNGIDDDCDGTVDNAPTCDSSIVSNPSAATDLAKAIDLCAVATAGDSRWGLLSATLTHADGTGVPAAGQYSVRPRFGTNVIPLRGASVLELATDSAAGPGDTNPAYEDMQASTAIGGSSQPPADFLAANGSALPFAPGCPAPAGTLAYDPIMLTLAIRVPTNARSFTLGANFFSSEFPEWVCSPYNDAFVVLLDSTYSGTDANPADKNLAFYQPAGGTLKYPVGVNLASGNTGLFRECVSGTIGCSSVGVGGSSGMISCPGNAGLAGTGLDTPAPNTCDANSLEGGGTGWLDISGNVVGGEVMKLRIALWNTGDHTVQSLVVLDGFQWSINRVTPGAMIAAP